MNKETDIVGYPHIRKIGRYLFYLPCALGFGLLGSVPLLKMGIDKDMASRIAIFIAFVAFLALRDIEKNAETRTRQALKGDSHD